MGTVSGSDITYVSGGTTVATYSTHTGVVTYATLATQANGATQPFGDIVLTVLTNTGNNGQLPATGTYQVTMLDATDCTVHNRTRVSGLPQPMNINDRATNAYHVVVTGQLADGSALHQTLRLI